MFSGVITPLRYKTTFFHAIASLANHWISIVETPRWLDGMRERERERAVEKLTISLETITLVEYILSWNKNSVTLPFLDNMYDRYSRGQYMFTGRDSRWKMPHCAPQSMVSSVVFSPVGVLSYTRKHTHAHSLRAPARAHAQTSEVIPARSSLIVKNSLFYRKFPNLLW